MTPEQLRLDETRAWLDRARRDLRAADLLVSGDSCAEALFHCQQAVEKSLKAFLTFHQRPFRKTHDLGELIADCVAVDGTLQATLFGSEALSQYAWRFRYPGAPYEPGKDEATHQAETVRTVLVEIERRLP
jgi:HEPN domain-containing protein